MRSTVSALVRYLLYGLLMGGADIIPGVSGGTMALIVGIYERLVGAISSAVSWGLALIRWDLDSMRRHWAAIPWRLVLPLAVGIGCAIAVGARVLPSLMSAYPEQMRGLFLGLVGASLLIPVLRMERLTGTYVVIGLVCGIAAFYLTGLPVFKVDDPGRLRVFLSAAVAICAMILPGVSGAFLLKVFGIYTPTLSALNSGDWAYVLVFILGAGVGLGAFAKLLDWLLTYRHDATMAALVGLIAGALRALWPYMGADRAVRLPDAADPVLSVVLLTIAGFAAVAGLLWWSRHRATTTTASTG